MIDWILAGTAATIGAGAVSVAAILFFNTKDFEAEYRDANKRILGKLFQEFAKEVEDWDKNKKTISKEEEFGLLHPQIQRLSEMASQFERTSRNMMRGKSLIRRMSACVFFGGISLAGTFAIFAVGDPGLDKYGYLPSVIMLYILAFGAGQASKYLRLVRDIDQKDADLSTGKLIFSQGAPPKSR